MHIKVFLKVSINLVCFSVALKFFLAFHAILLASLTSRHLYEGQRKGFSVLCFSDPSSFAYARIALWKMARPSVLSVLLAPHYFIPANAYLVPKQRCTEKWRQLQRRLHFPPCAIVLEIHIQPKHQSSDFCTRTKMFVPLMFPMKSSVVLADGGCGPIFLEASPSYYEIYIKGRPPSCWPGDFCLPQIVPGTAAANATGSH